MPELDKPRQSPEETRRIVKEKIAAMKARGEWKPVDWHDFGPKREFVVAKPLEVLSHWFDREKGEREHDPERAGTGFLARVGL